MTRCCASRAVFEYMKSKSWSEEEKEGLPGHCLMRSAAQLIPMLLLQSIATAACCSRARGRIRHDAMGTRPGSEGGETMSSVWEQQATLWLCERLGAMHASLVVGQYRIDSDSHFLGVLVGERSYKEPIPCTQRSPSRVLWKRLS